MEVRSLVAINVRRLRVAKGISQDDLALIAGVERAYVGHIERATKNPTIVTLEKIAVALDRHVSELFEEPSEATTAIAPLKAGRKKR
jgi:transcriptional regulator with XRE-family HTH domain